MFNKFKEAVEASLDALAPPPSLYDDFTYHWKRFMKHYVNFSRENAGAVEHTCLPECLDRLKEILIAEDQEIEESNGVKEVGPCMNHLLKHDSLDMLVSLAISDEPPGMKSCILTFLCKIITQLKEPNIAHSAIYIPLMKIMNICDGLLHSVSEAEEIEFLLHLCSVLRKQQSIAVLFFCDENTKILEEVAEYEEYCPYANILDLVLTYVDSADSKVRVKACQCIFLLCSMDDNKVAECIVNNYKFNHFIIGRLTTLFCQVPPVDYEYFKDIKSSWTLDIPQESQLEIIQNRSAIVFFCWVDFVNQLSLECHPLIQERLCQSITTHYLQEAFNPKYLSSGETIAMFHKYYKMITSPILQKSFQKWLTDSGGDADVLDITGNIILQVLVDNCVSENEFIELTTLEFFLEVLNRCDKEIIHSLVLCYVKDRSYYDTSSTASSWSEEEDERRKLSCNPESSSSSKTLAPSNVDKIIKNFENLVPIQVRTQFCKETLLYLQKQYEEVVNQCSTFEWPSEATSDVESVSNDSNPESDCFPKLFSEGPFLKIVFMKLRNFHKLSLDQMIVLSNIISKLALLPHPFLHEYLLNPLLPLKEGIPSLYSLLSHVITDVCARVQMIVDYQNELRATKERLLSDDKCSYSRNEIDRYLEACILLEQLTVEIATFVYVKYSFNH